MKRASLLLLLAACGDNLAATVDLEPSSGGRLRIAWMLYDDGSRQLDPDAFYDVQQHTRCTVQTWIDGIDRCVPDADEADYIDAACTSVAGRVTSIDEPTHFLGYERRDGIRYPAHVYRAGTARTPVSWIFHLRDGVCRGPVPVRRGTTYHEITSELGGDALVALHDSELADGEARIALRMRDSDDGAHVPVGLRDRTLGFDCTATGTSEAVACEPAHAVATELYRDPSCAEPGVAVDEARGRLEPTSAADSLPSLVRVVGRDGCSTYHSMGSEIAPVLYRRDGDRCTRVSPAPSRAFSVGTALELAPLERTVEPSDRRLDRVILATGDLVFAADRMFDTATRADCRPRQLEDRIACIPTSALAATSVFAAGCTREIRIANVPARTCEPHAFAIAAVDHFFQVHAIGDPASDPLFHATPSGCVPYEPPAGTTPHVLGPVLPPDTFLRGYSTGER